VDLSPFLIAKHEVTQAQWNVVMEGRNPSRFDGDALPVERVSWNVCTGFCKKIGLSLPTEAQWEYACRAGTSTRFSFGQTITLDEVNFNGDDPALSGDDSEEFRRKQTVEVGSLPANGFGLHEMHGNVAEWCKDVFDRNFYRQPRASGPDPLCNPPHRLERVVRGGSFHAPAPRCRSGFRGDQPQPRMHRAPFIGFRPARSVP
jgi:formylglycine-generating enzyme required for sulfatase activity